MQACFFLNRSKTSTSKHCYCCAQIICMIVFEVGKEGGLALCHTKISLFLSLCGATVDTRHQYSEDWLSSVLLSSRTFYFFSACGTCLQA